MRLRRKLGRHHPWEGVERRKSSPPGDAETDCPGRQGAGRYPSLRTARLQVRQTVTAPMETSGETM